MEKIVNIWDAADKISLVCFLVIAVFSAVGLSMLSCLIGIVGFAFYLYRAYNDASRFWL